MASNILLVTHQHLQTYLGFIWEGKFQIWYGGEGQIQPPIQNIVECINVRLRE